MRSEQPSALEKRMDGLIKLADERMAERSMLLETLRTIKRFADLRWGAHHCFRDISDMAEEAIRKVEGL